MERVSQYRDRESNRDRASGTTGSLSVRPFDPRPRPAQNNNDAAAQELGAQSAKEHERDPQRAPERQISSLEPGEIPVPTELHWSNGAVTAPTVRDLLVNDECMSMIIHQTMLFTDFFARHPEATLGDSIVTDEMRRYLDDVRAFYPDYLSTRATSEATPRPEFNDSGTTARCGGNEEGSGVKRESSNGGGGGKGRDVKREGSADRIAAVYGRR